ncbi:MAG TPA: YjbQ family protein [Candidatus Krumholzibacteria bacterium]|nr:YjbQ family protein [Candidatus Krumholzibacteria bacterium]
MRIETTRLEISTDEGVSIADLTDDVNAFIRSTGVRDGLCVMMVGRHECFLSLAPELDDAFDDLMRLVREADALQAEALRREPATDADRADVDTSGPAPPGFLAETLSFAVREGAPELGSWESILLVDGGGPARRAIEVTVMGSTSAPT